MLDRDWKNRKVSLLLYQAGNIKSIAIVRISVKQFTIFRTFDYNDVVFPDRLSRKTLIIACTQRIPRRWSIALIAYVWLSTRFWESLCHPNLGLQLLHFLSNVFFSRYCSFYFHSLYKNPKRAPDLLCEAYLGDYVTFWHLFAFSVIFCI